MSLDLSRKLLTTNPSAVNPFVANAASRSQQAPQFAGTSLAFSPPSPASDCFTSSRTSQASAKPADNRAQQILGGLFFG